MTAPVHAGAHGDRFREDLSFFAREQAALRRVATLVARESSSSTEIFRTVTEEARRVLETEAVGMLRFDPDASATLVAQSETPWEPPPLGTRFTLDGENLIAEVFRTGRPARDDDWARASGAVAAMANVLGVRSCVATPIVVEGRLWGSMIAATSQRGALPGDTESRIGEFTELVATAIANAEARAEIERLADEQAALRHVAELVAREASQTEVFSAIAEAIGGLLGEELRMVRYEDDAAVVVAGSEGAHSHVLPVGARIPLGGNNVLSRVFRTGEPARIDDYSAATGPIADAVRSSDPRSVVATPIIVAGRSWGAMLVGTFGEEPVPAGCEGRLGEFTELMATAIANADARAELIASRARISRQETRRAAGSSATSTTGRNSDSSRSASTSNTCAGCCPPTRSMPSRTSSARSATSNRSWRTSASSRAASIPRSSRGAVSNSRSEGSS